MTMLLPVITVEFTKISEIALNHFGCWCSTGNSLIPFRQYLASYRDEM